MYNLKKKIMKWYLEIKFVDSALKYTQQSFIKSLKTWHNRIFAAYCYIFLHYKWTNIKTIRSILLCFIFSRFPNIFFYLWKFVKHGTIKILLAINIFFRVIKNKQILKQYDLFYSASFFLVFIPFFYLNILILWYVNFIVCSRSVIFVFSVIFNIKNISFYILD